jgi:hypothetical protein
MTRTPIDLDQERFAVWDCPQLLERAAAAGRLLEADNPAVRLQAGDPPEAWSSQSNRHTIFLGAQRLLQEWADYFVAVVHGQLGFCKDSSCSWFERRGGIIGLIRSFFSGDAHALGMVSITPMRRPQPYHTMAAPGIEVTSVNPPGLRFVPAHLVRKWEPWVSLGEHGKAKVSLPLRDLDFAPAVDSRDAANRWVKLVVTRAVTDRRFSLLPHQASYQETWLCRGRPAEDRARLLQGHIPAVSPDRYQGHSLRVRLTPMFGLYKINLPPSDGRGSSAVLGPANARAPSIQYLAVEIDAAAGGKILSIRHGWRPLSVLCLSAGPAEHVGICKILRSLA